MPPQSTLRQFAKLGTMGALAGAIGIQIGIKYQETSIPTQPSDNEPILRRRPPGLPIFASVSAAEPIALAPVPAVPAVPVPRKESGIPPEPAPGTNRISEIMRFGFPGLDHIRSHKSVEQFFVALAY